MLKVEIKVNAETTYTFLEEENLIEGFSLTRKMDSDISSLVAEIEAGEVNLTLSNLFNEFNVLSENAPYKGLKNGQELKVYNDENLLFTGFVVDFVAPTSTNAQSCNLRAVDRLQMLLNNDISAKSEIQINENMNFFEYFTTLFNAYGVLSSEIEIDANLEQITLNYTILNGKTLSEQLNEACKATDAYLYVNNMGKIILKSKSITGTPTMTFSRESDDHYLMSSEYGYGLFSSYNALKVGYTTTKLSDVQNILSVGDLSVSAGETTFENYALGISNLYELDNIKITSDSDSTITSISATASTISCTINNPTTSDDIISIDIYGKTIETADAFLTYELGSAAVNQSLEVSSILVQNKAYAEGLALKLYDRAMQPIPYIRADVEIINFGLDLGTIVCIEDSEAEITYTGYVHTIEVEYDGNGYSFYSLGIKALNEEEVSEDE